MICDFRFVTTQQYLQVESPERERPVTFSEEQQYEKYKANERISIHKDVDLLTLYLFSMKIRSRVAINSRMCRSGVGVSRMRTQIKGCP